MVGVTYAKTKKIKEWLRAEKSKRAKEDKKKWKTDQKELRSYYLNGEEDYKFQKGEERAINRNAILSYSWYSM